MTTVLESGEDGWELNLGLVGTTIGGLVVFISRLARGIPVEIAPGLFWLGGVCRCQGAFLASGENAAIGVGGGGVGARHAS